MTASPARTKHTLRVEDDALVRGGGHFMDDPRLPNTAYAAFVRSPHAHAKVLSLNADEVRKAKDVLAVLTADDIKAAGIGNISRHPPVVGRGGAKMVMAFRPALAEKAMHVGDPVAMVVAASHAAAQDAVDLMQVEYEELAPVVDLKRYESRNAITSRRAGNLCVGGRARAEQTTSAGRPDHQKTRRTWRVRVVISMVVASLGARCHCAIRRGKRELHCMRARRAPTVCARRRPPSWAYRMRNCA